MQDIHSLVNEFVVKLRKRQIEGSKATAKQTAELLRLFISSMRIPNTDQAGALIDAVKIVGEQLITASPVAAVGCMNLSGESDDEIVDEDDHPVLSAAAVAAAAATARSTLRPPSLQTLLEDMPHSAAIPHSTSSGCDSEGKSKCDKPLDSPL